MPVHRSAISSATPDHAARTRRSWIDYQPSVPRSVDGPESALRTSLTVRAPGRSGCHRHSRQRAWVAQPTVPDWPTARGSPHRRTSVNSCEDADFVAACVHRRRKLSLCASDGVAWLPALDREEARVYRSSTPSRNL